MNQEVLKRFQASEWDEWSEETRASALQVLYDYDSIISKHDMDLGNTTLMKHDIKLDNYKPFKQPYRRIPPHLYGPVKEHLQEMLDIGAIRPSHSPWSSAIVLVQKKDGGLRFCIDLRELNNRTIKDNYSLPRIEEHLEQLKGAKWFTTLDLKSGYWQVELTEEAKPLTGFTMGPLGFYECNQMPFGACNAPATFQRLMESCLGDLNLNWCLVYLDDIIIYSKTPEEHVERLRAVFQKLKEAGLKLKPSKCNFFQKEISFLGHIVSERGIATDPKKIEKVAQWPVPETIHDVRSFLGFVGYYRKYIKGFSSIAKPLTSLLTGLESNSKYSAKKFKVCWGKQEQSAFDQLKLACTTAPVLGYADFSEDSKPFVVHTDSSGSGLGAVLYQEDSSGAMRVISYASRSLNRAEKLYPAHKLEFLALKWAVTDKFKDYLYGKHFEVYTDNNPLTYILTSAKLDAVGQRWVASLAPFSFDIYYKSGKHNVDADGLSRIKWPESHKDVLANRQISAFLPKAIINAICLGVQNHFGYSETLGVHSQIIPTELSSVNSGMTQDHWIKLQSEDSVINYLKTELVNKTLRKKNKETMKIECSGVEKYFPSIPDLIVKDSILYKKTYTYQGKRSFLLQIILPPSLVQDALVGCHDQVGHLGRDKTLNLLKERFYWPGMSKAVGFHIANCSKCLKRKGKTSKAQMVPIHVSKPLELVHLDYLQLEPSKGNIENVLVITDHFTRFAQAYPSKSQTAHATAKLLWDNFIVHYGFPEKFFSDQGRNFVSELIKDLCRIAKVEKIRTTPYHPQSNGQCERFNKTLCDMIGTLDTEDKADWKSHLSSLTHAYNCTQNASTGYCPYYLMFGRLPRLPIDVQFGLFRNRQDITFSRSKYVDRLKKRLDFAYEKAYEAQCKSSSRNKKRYDRSATACALEKGDLVLVRALRHKGKHKLQNRWEDKEYVVMAQLDPNIPVYTVQPVGGGKERTLHRNLLLPLGVKADQQDLVSDDSDEELLELVVPQKPESNKQVESEGQISFEGENQEGQVLSSSDDKSGFAEASKDDSVENPEASDEQEDKSTDVLFNPEREELPSENLVLIDSDNEDSGEHSKTQSTVLENTAFTAHRGAEVDSSFFDKLPEPDEEAKSGQDQAEFLIELDKVIQPSKFTVANKSEPQESSSSSESEVEEPVVPTRRVSSRKTKGAPPTRYGYAVTHKVDANPVQSNSQSSSQGDSVVKSTVLALGENLKESKEVTESGQGLTHFFSKWWK